jgi:hypothetical protein
MFELNGISLVLLPVHCALALSLAVDINRVQNQIANVLADRPAIRLRRRLKRRPKRRLNPNRQLLALADVLCHPGSLLLLDVAQQRTVSASNDSQRFVP